MSTLRRPNLFIVGAPKCGTTALYSYLGEHSEVFMSPLKEPQFFASDIFAHQRSVASFSEYMNCFAQANGQKRVGEASVAYLGSRTAAREIKTFSPSARIIIMLRNPVDVMHAQHSQRLFDDMEHIRDFEAAVASDGKRIWRYGQFKGEEIMRLPYRELCRFAGAVRRYFDVFGRENVMVILYDDFRSNTAAVYAEVLLFLQIAPHPKSEYPIINANRRVRNMAVQGFVLHPPKRLRRLIHASFSQKLRRRVGEFAQRLNTVSERRLPISDELRGRLARESKPDIEELSSLLGRDLSHWYRATVST